MLHVFRLQATVQLCSAEEAVFSKYCLLVHGEEATLSKQPPFCILSLKHTLFPQFRASLWSLLV